MKDKKPEVEFMVKNDRNQVKGRRVAKGLGKYEKKPILTKIMLNPQQHRFNNQ